MISPRVILLAAWLVAAAARPATADGGLVRLDDVAGRYKVVALTSPTPVREGEVDITIMVRDAIDSIPVDDVIIHVAIVGLDDEGPAGGDWEPLEQGRIRHPGGAGAVFQISPGEFRVLIRIVGALGTETVEFPLEVGASMRFHDVWPWLIPLPIFIALWVLREESKLAGRTNLNGENQA